MSWYTTEGADNLHVIRSETQYIRNITALPFSSKMSSKQLSDLSEKAEKILNANGFKKEQIGQSPANIASYAEKGFLDANLCDSYSANTSFSLYFNEPCSLAVTVGGRDHLTIRSLLSGRAVTETRSIAIEAEELFDRQFEFAYSPSFGYLSPSLNRCGSGEYFSAILFLPAAAKLGEIDKIALKCQNFGAKLTPMFTHPKNSGDMYHLSFSPHFLTDSASCARGFDALISSVIEKEKLYEGIILEEKRKIIIDSAHRAFGTLLFAKRISEDEMLSHISSIRLNYADISNETDSPPVSLSSLNLLLAEGLNSSILSSSPKISCEEELEERRAEFIKTLLSAEKSNQRPIPSAK